jgi:hypothetical protein
MVLAHPKELNLKDNIHQFVAMTQVRTVDLPHFANWQARQAVNIHPSVYQAQTRRNKRHPLLVALQRTLKQVLRWA